MAASITSTPSYWTNKSSQCVFLEDATAIKATLIGIIKSTWDPTVVGAGHDASKLKHSAVEITAVKRVENASLFHSYSNKKQEFEKRGRPCPTIGKIQQELANFNKTERNPAVNEYYLFHGTEEALSIARTGFQTRFADPRSLYGKGIYFTDSFQKADQYSDDPIKRTPLGTELTVIMSRVLLGHACKRSKEDAEKLTRPPCMQHAATCACGPLQRYDSVESTHLLFREFVVYEGKQCYPEYIITYKRTETQSIGRQTEFSRPESSPEAILWKRAVESVTVTFHRHPQHNDISKLYAFCQKMKRTPPVFVFHDNRQSVENKWECVCRISSPFEATAESTGRRKKIAKRLAAEQIWEMLNRL